MLNFLIQICQAIGLKLLKPVDANVVSSAWVQLGRYMKDHGGSDTYELEGDYQIYKLPDGQYVVLLGHEDLPIVDPDLA